MSQSCLHSAMVIDVYCNAGPEGLLESPEDQSVFCESSPVRMTAMQSVLKNKSMFGLHIDFFRDLRECHEPYSFDLCLFH